MSRLLPVDEIEDNMVLVEPVVNHFGQTLLPAGATLSTKQKRLLKTWNIQFVTIKTSEDDIQIEVAPEILEKAKEILASRMKWEPTSKHELDLYQAGLIHIAQEIQKQKKGY